MFRAGQVRAVTADRLLVPGDCNFSAGLASWPTAVSLLSASFPNAIVGNNPACRFDLKDREMTWSIIARDAEHGKFGIAVATRFFAAGALVPYARAGIGAVATQALVNPFFGPLGLALLQKGATAAEVVSRLIADDAGRDHRQLH